MKEFRALFNSSLPFDYTASKDAFKIIDMSYALIDEYHMKLSKIKQEAADFNGLEKLFELE